MTTVLDIYSYIDSFAPFSAAEDWDNVGVLVGDESAAVTKAVVSLDITNGVLDEAKRLGAELVISHHPIIFSGIKKLGSDSPVYRAAQYGISCICAHTNLDKSPVFGVNTALSDALGLTDCKVSGSNEILFTANTLSPVSARELAKSACERLGIESVSYIDGGRTFSKVGVCSGGGGGEIFSAFKEGCGAFVTGEIKHHELLFAKEHGISVFVLGHYKSEDVVIEPLAQLLSEKFTETVFVKSKVFTDGVKHFSI